MCAIVSDCASINPIATRFSLALFTARDRSVRPRQVQSRTGFKPRRLLAFSVDGLSARDGASLTFVPLWIRRLMRSHMKFPMVVMSSAVNGPSTNRALVILGWNIWLPFPSLPNA